MRRTVKVAAWVAVFAACAAVGAFIASRTDPFPPGVQDPGARSAPSPTTIPTPAGEPWGGVVAAGTSHQLFVGGRCSTAWRMRLDFLVHPGGVVTGTAIARLQGRLRCDFPTAQVQSKVLHLRVSGDWAGSRVRLLLRPAGRSPAGSDDYGGLMRTLPAFPALKIRAGSIDLDTQVRAPDAGRGTYVAHYRIALDCLGC